MPDYKDTNSRPSRPPPTWWRRNDAVLVLQAILALLLLRLVLYSHMSVDAAEHESPTLFTIKFAALVLVLLCLAFQALQ